MEMQNNVNKKIQGLNEVVEEWKGTFDTKPELDMVFSARGNMLCLNNIVLCPLDSAQPEKLFHDCEEFTLETTDGVSFSIVIDWPFEGNARVCSILRCYEIYSATGN